MGAEDWAWRWGVEDASFGLPCAHKGSPITPDTRERYMAGYNSHEARVKANAAMVQRAKDKAAKAQKQWVAKLEDEPHKPVVRRGKHEHGKDW